MPKVPNWEIAKDFLEKNGQITAMDIVAICNSVSPHKYLQILREKVGLKELENTGKPYKIFVKAPKQMSLGL